MIVSRLTRFLMIMHLVSVDLNSMPPHSHNIITLPERTAIWLIWCSRNLSRIRPFARTTLNNARSSAMLRTWASLMFKHTETRRKTYYQIQHSSMECQSALQWYPLPTRAPIFLTATFLLRSQRTHHLQRYGKARSSTAIT